VTKAFLNLIEYGFLFVHVGESQVLVGDARPILDEFASTLTRHHF
jgi:hypothetical protein